MDTATSYISLLLKLEYVASLNRRPLVVYLNKYESVIWNYYHSSFFYYFIFKVAKVNALNWEKRGNILATGDCDDNNLYENEDRRRHRHHYFVEPPPLSGKHPLRLCRLCSSSLPNDVWQADDWADNDWIMVPFEWSISQSAPYLEMLMAIAGLFDHIIHVSERTPLPIV